MEKIIIFSILVEAVTNIVKGVYKKDEGIQLPVIISLVIAVACTSIFSIDMFSILGFVGIAPYAGYVLTGIIISRGSNMIHEIYNKISGGGADGGQSETV